MSCPLPHRALLATVLVLAACSQSDLEEEPATDASLAEAAASSVLSVYVVNYPLQYFAERIGGELVNVVLPIPMSVDPAHWSPTAEEILPFQQADMILLNGASYAEWVTRATLPETRSVNTSLPFSDRLIGLEGGRTHSHGVQGEHSHAGLASHTWLDPTLAVEQAGVIAEAFTSALPEHRDQFATALAALTEDLQGIDAELFLAVERLQDYRLVFSHPVYQYLIARYQLSARSLTLEPEEVLSSAQWAELGELLGTGGSSAVVWEAAPLGETVTRLEDAGHKSVIFEPAGNLPATGDYLQVMRRNTAAFRGLAELDP